MSSDYKGRCYAFLRDPIERRKSIVRYRTDQGGCDPYKLEGIWLRPQRDWFYLGNEQIVIPLDFRRFEEELYRFVELTGEKIPSVPWENKSSMCDVHLSPRVYEVSPLAEDLEFYYRCFPPELV